MKKIVCGVLLGALVFLASCKKDDTVECLSCTSEFTASFNICKESDGNAWVNGQNTKVPYDQYLKDLEETGVECNR